MENNNLKKVIVLCAIGMAVFACKKKEEPAKEDPTPAPTVVCFNSNNNGTYTAAIGSIQSGTTITSFSTGTVTISRTACQEVSFNLTTPAGNKSELITNVTLNSSSGYDGNVSTGSISMSFGSHLSANAPGSFTVLANK